MIDPADQVDWPRLRALATALDEAIARHGTVQARTRWIPRLLAGELAGIAVTEPHGGSRPAETRTHAVPGPDGIWLVSGRKTWISRLTEAAVFVVFFRAGRPTAPSPSTPPSWSAPASPCPSQPPRTARTPPEWRSTPTSCSP